MIISVYGNNGAGKSSLAIKLALEYARKKKNVVLLDTDYNAPQINVWYPKLDVQPNTSMSVLLDNNIDVEAVVGKMHAVDKYLGVIGYAKDHAANIIPSRSDTPETLLQVLPQIADVVVVDCQSNVVHSIFTLASLMHSDVRLITMTPDVRGLSWYDSNVRMLEEGWANNNQKVIKTFNQTKITSPVTEIENAVGNVEFYLPYTSEIQEEMNEGRLGTNEGRSKLGKYAKIVESIANTIG